jgi:hypothetical protein
LADKTQYWKVSLAPAGIVITVHGHDKERAAHKAVAEFNALARDYVGPFTIVGDVREMTGYETDSRQAWQQAFRNHRTRIREFVLVGAKSPLIRMGAAAVGVFASIRVRFVASWDEIDGAIPKDV